MVREGGGLRRETKLHMQQLELKVQGGLCAPYVQVWYFPFYIILLLLLCQLFYNKHNAMPRHDRPAIDWKFTCFLPLNKVYMIIHVVSCVNAYSLCNNSHHPKAPLVSTKSNSTKNSIRSTQSMDKLTNKPNAMESTQTYPYYSRQVCCFSVETWPPPGGPSCSDMNEETCTDDQKSLTSTDFTAI